MPGMGTAMPGMGMGEGTPMSDMSMRGEFDLMFIDMMISHHEGAIAKAEVALDRAEHEEIRTLAEEIIAAQTAEIDWMRAWRDDWYPGAPEMPMNQMMPMMGEMMQDMPDMAGTDMMSMMDMSPGDQQAALCAASEPFDLAFIDAMIPHHQSAVAMAKVAVQNATHPELTQLAEGIIEAQEREIAQLQDWRTSWYRVATPNAEAEGSPQAGAPIRVALTEGEMYIETSQTSFHVGETYTFVVTNEGQIPHDLVIAPVGEEHEHETDHEGGANMLVGIEPGQTRDLFWSFSTPGAWEIACRLPGHYEAGMSVEVDVAS
jgi:uncharacterized protein (DUF305 family)